MAYDNLLVGFVARSYNGRDPFDSSDQHGFRKIEPVSSGNAGGNRGAMIGSGGTTIRLEWCPGYAGVPGNEEADDEAPRAATGHTHPPQLPDYRPFTSPTTHKKTMKVANQKRVEVH
ncbi:hypothetical protein B0J17DRAFT_631906 [Rhizoctonia solani]|nr:hypothetical protein B0J17DRAFT_631906 [Rhizoctonia solani]